MQNSIFPLNKLLSQFLEQRLIYAQMFPETLQLLHINMSAVSSWSARVELTMWPLCWTRDVMVYTSFPKEQAGKQPYYIQCECLVHYMNIIWSCSAQNMNLGGASPT